MTPSNLNALARKELTMNEYLKQFKPPFTAEFSVIKDSEDRVLLSAEATKENYDLARGIAWQLNLSMNDGGWLIETEQNTYWDGRQIGDDAVFLRDANDAVRFSRQQDAEVVRCWLLEKVSRAQRLRSAEHLFIGPKNTDALTTAATPPSEPRRIEVDIGAALAALTSSPELCEKINELVGGPALKEASAEIERLTALLATTPPAASAGPVTEEVCLRALNIVKSSGEQCARTNPGRDVVIAWSAWEAVVKALSTPRAKASAPEREGER